MSLRRTTDATTEPVTLAEAKLWGRLTADTTDDAVVTALITSARMACEQELGRSLITQTWTMTASNFPDDGFTLRWPTIISVTSVKYYDTSNVQQTLATSVYGLDATQEPGRLYLKSGQSWPDVYDRPEAVEVIYTAGYGAASAVPEGIKSWIKCMVAHYYDTRSAASETKLEPLPFIAGLLDPFRVYA